MIICSNEDEEKSYIVSKLQLFRKQYTAFADTAKFQHYLKSHFTVDTETQQQHGVVMAASGVDHEKYVSEQILTYREALFSGHQCDTTAE